MKIFLLLLPLFLLSCQPTVSKSNAETSDNQKTPDPKIALQFINDYVAFANDMGNSKMSIVEWVSKQSTVTEDFKKELKSIIEKAEKDDPELGLGFDPIFNAQDYPDKGFELEKLDPTGYLVAKGNDMEKVVMKVKLVNGSWLVDGAGIINIPEDKRSKR